MIMAQVAKAGIILMRIIKAYRWPLESGAYVPQINIPKKDLKIMIKYLDDPTNTQYREFPGS